MTTDDLATANAHLTERLATTHRTIANLNHRLLNTDDHLYTELARVLATLRELNGMWLHNNVIDLRTEIERVEGALAKSKG